MFGNLEKNNKNRIKQIEFEKQKNVFQIHLKTDVCTIKNKVKLWDIVGKNMVDFDKL